MTDTIHPIPLASQIGGHPGVQSSEDGSLIIKPAMATEAAFYHALASDERLRELRQYVPIFYGTLKLHGAVEGSEAEKQALSDGEHKDECRHPPLEFARLNSLSSTVNSARKCHTPLHEAKFHGH